MTDTVLSPNLLDQPLDARPRRWELLPTWIKVFTYLFLLTGVVIPIAFVASLLGFATSLSLYGIQSLTPFDPAGALLAALFVFKGIAAYGLFNEERWGIFVAMVDGIIGIIVCSTMMIVVPIVTQQQEYTFRLELLLLVPYVMRLQHLRLPWEQARQERSLFGQ